MRPPTVDARARGVSVRVSTYSLVAYDGERSEWGVAVQSKFPAIGALTPWAEAGVGAIATQSWIEVRYGREGLALLREGVPAEEALERLKAGDEGREKRQVGIVDRGGRAATFTGAECTPWAGGRLGPGYAAQGNMLVSQETVDAMAETFEATQGPLAERLLAALKAAQAAGGDRRGQQAAALKVVRVGAGYGGSGIVVDLRVDDHPEPLTELDRLYRLHERYFGSTPRELWVPATADLTRRIRGRLRELGYGSGDLAADLEAWAGYENLEERLDGIDAFDPILLEELLGRPAA
ncbi:MAG TPA: DUF1028 domain-containing protein [Gaiellaceae bacterium]|nr:DUF1028 domain-containing protein [Gaiellaceae bacterium]